jgi:hypothetical protein
MDLSILVIAGKWNTARMTGLEMTVRLREGLTEAKLCEKSPQFVYQRRCRCFGVSYWKRTSIQMKLRLSKSTMQNLVCRNLHFKPCHVSMRAERFISPKLQMKISQNEDNHTVRTEYKLVEFKLAYLA